MMLPFTDQVTGRSFCPQRNDNSDPLFSILGFYTGDTEGLYLAEKEAETITDGSVYKTVYGTMFATETILKNYGFIIENGIKVKANDETLHKRTIYFYWPADITQDPLNAGDRKLYTVRSPDSLFDNIPTGIDINLHTSDKRIGCVPKINE